MTFIKKLSAYSQYILPHHVLTRLSEWIMGTKQPALKNFLIRQFMKRYPVNLNDALIENPLDYQSFHDFFIRQLKPTLRPIASGANDIISPVDGIVAQIGLIKEDHLIQAKNFYFDLSSLFAGDDAYSYFNQGSFATLYLAPHHYHRVHMPLTGKLEKTIDIPGRLFSVNRISSETIPNIFTRNERLISIFDTAAGKMAVILVGALIVGNIKTTWRKDAIRSSKIRTQIFSDSIELSKGDELGYFTLGSTVILLFAKNRITWSPHLEAGMTLKFGQEIAKIS